jgi:hypothetical protein
MMTLWISAGMMTASRPGVRFRSRKRIPIAPVNENEEFVKSRDHPNERDDEDPEREEGSRHFRRGAYGISKNRVQLTKRRGAGEVPFKSN